MEEKMNSQNNLTGGGVKDLIKKLRYYLLVLKTILLQKKELVNLFMHSKNMLMLYR